MPRALGADGSIAWQDVVTMLAVRNQDRFAIRDGDVLLPLRSQSMQAVVARNCTPGVIAVGQWAIITPIAERSTSDYLAWYLNHPTTRAKLVGAMIGTSLQFLTLRAVRDFEIEVPPMALQQRIGCVAALSMRVSHLERALDAARRTLTDALTMDALNCASANTH